MAEPVKPYHLTVPKSTRALLLDQEAIEQVMVEKQIKKLKANGKARTAHPDAKSNTKRKVSGGLVDQVLKKPGSEKFCQVLQSPRWPLPDTQHLGLPSL